MRSSLEFHDASIGQEKGQAEPRSRDTIRQVNESLHVPASGPRWTEELRCPEHPLRFSSPDSEEQPIPPCQRLGLPEPSLSLQPSKCRSLVALIQELVAAQPEQEVPLWARHH